MSYPLRGEMSSARYALSADEVYASDGSRIIRAGMAWGERTVYDAGFRFQGCRCPGKQQPLSPGGLNTPMRVTGHGPNSINAVSYRLTDGHRDQDGLVVTGNSGWSSRERPRS